MKVETYEFVNGLPEAGALEGVDDNRNAMPAPALIVDRPGAAPAVLLREFLLAGVRLRSGAARISNAAKFRETAARNLEKLGDVWSGSGIPARYSDAAGFAVAAFLDDTILKSRASASWADCTLEQQIWKKRLGGEAFFNKLQGIEKDADSRELGDLLEVFCLAMLLGFEGKHRSSRGGEIARIIERLARRIARIRQMVDALSPEAGLPIEPPLVEPTDQWARRLKIAALATMGLALSGYVAFLCDLGNTARKAAGL